jgi:hypothetical protein
LAAYANDFKPEGMAREVWEKQRSDRINKSKIVEVAVSDLNVSVQDDSHVMVSFTQKYRSDGYRDQIVKTLQMVKQFGRWLIVKEITGKVVKVDDDAKIESEVGIEVSEQTKLNAHSNVSDKGVISPQGQGVESEQREKAEAYRKAAEQGNPQAQFNLGKLYEQGSGVPQSYALAAKWYYMSALQGNAEAYCSIGMMNELGLGVARNYKHAILRYREASELGYAEAYRRLGKILAEGRGVEVDLVQSHKWFDLAYKAGIESVGNDLKQIEGKMNAKQIDQARQLVQEWLKTHK